MYAKFIDGVLTSAPRKIKDGDAVTYNPTAEMLTALGYKPVRYTEEPEAVDGYYNEMTWTETDEAIVQVWTMVEDLYADEASPDEIEEALGGIV